MRDTARGIVNPSISMPVEFVEALDRVAAKRHWTRSFLIREIVREYLDRHNEPIGAAEPVEKAS